MSVTIEELNGMAAKIDELRRKEAEAKLIVKGISEELEKAEHTMIEVLSDNGMTSYKSPVGTCSISFRTSVKVPKTDTDRQAFFQYLRDKGVYDSMITVNSQTINSFYKAELELAKEAGDDSFSIPGLSEVTLNQVLSFRRG